jgi:hypothetical protein
MKGTVSPELRYILKDPKLREKFYSEFFNRDRTVENINIKLDDDTQITIKNFGNFTTRKNKKSRNILDLLLGF